MKKLHVLFCFLFAIQLSGLAQSTQLRSYLSEELRDDENRLAFIKIKESHRVQIAEVQEFINIMILENSQNKAILLKSENDAQGYTHLRFNIVQNGFEIANRAIVAHCFGGKLVSLNGDLANPSTSKNSFVMDEKAALKYALRKVGAEKYKWENTDEEAHMRSVLNQPEFTYYPHGKKVILQKNGQYIKCYQFNIYAEVPLYRANVFVDASNGKVIDEQNLICTSDVPGTAVTKYSGTQTITCDNNGSLHTLKEVSRGNGIETYNLKNTQVYTNNNFTSTPSTWTLAAFDQGALDAHWGAEKTYDYYWTQHNRNSINNAGFKLISYVHYGTNYSNAFWDGQRMTYGDGNNGSMKIFTALDVCGHEISHGLTSSTSNLQYSNESGALNESYSDIFGSCIENYARPSNWNWKIGEDLTSNGTGLRNMSAPNIYTDPDTYKGTYWYFGTADNGGVHTNSGVSNYWFYLLSTGGSGTNDISNAYSVTGLGINKAANIAFRALTMYYTSSTNYATARLLSIQAAKDLYGDCSNEMVQTTNAWYAVGVGAQYTPGAVTPDFTAGFTSFCTLPATVSLMNTTPDAMTYSWDFGDGSAAVTSTNAVHVYTANGTYNVKLIAVGCANVTDSIEKSSFVVVNVPNAPVVTNTSVCINNSAVLTANGANDVKWFNDPAGMNQVGTGSTYTTSSLTNSVTYYVSNSYTNAPGLGGLMTNVGGGYLTNPAQWLIFDVVANGTLNSVVMYAQTAGTRTIELRSSSNALINTISTSLSVGANTVILYFPLTVGTNYQLGLAANSTSSLYRSNSGVNFPYYIGGSVVLKNSSNGLGSYYWFYKWEVTKEECTSPIVPVSAMVNALPTVSVTTQKNKVCRDDAPITFVGSPSGGTYSGTATSATGLFDPMLQTSGTHTISYYYTDANSCSSSAQRTVQVSECTGVNELNSSTAVQLFPNPTKDRVTLKLGASQKDASITLMDATGRIVLQQSITGEEVTLDLSTLANGLYMMSLRSADNIISTSKIIKE